MSTTPASGRSPPRCSPTWNRCARSRRAIPSRGRRWSMASCRVISAAARHGKPIFRSMVLAALWALHIEEASGLDGGWRPDASFFAQRAAEIERLRGYQLPDLFRRFDDLERSSVGAAAVSAERRLVGISLTTGEVRGRAWV